ncbi:cinnamoyl-Coa reductase [Ancistrocladus abbreviatus]
MVRHQMNQPGKSLGVMGLGGLGHMAVKFGKAFGLNVTVFSTTVSKKDEALTVLGAGGFVVSSDEQQMKDLARSLDFIIDTVPGNHPLDPYIQLLKPGGVISMVGVPDEAKFAPVNIVVGMNIIAGSAVAGTKVTTEMLEFCAAHKVYPMIEKIPIQYINEACERMLNKDVKYRFVIDVENSLE